jgi:hypothetical protein
MVSGQQVLEPVAIRARRRLGLAPTEGRESEIDGELCAHIMVIRPPVGNRSRMSQFEQENDLGRGGGEVDEKTMDEAWDAAKERLGDQNAPDAENGD